MEIFTPVSRECRIIPELLMGSLLFRHEFAAAALEVAEHTEA